MTQRPNALHTSTRSVSAVAVKDLAEELLRLNLITGGWLKHNQPDIFSALTNEFEINTESRFSESTIVSLWNKLQDSKAENIGLLIGNKVNDQAKGILANWISQCRTLNDAFSIFTKNIQLLNPAEHWTIQTQGNSVQLTFQFDSEHHYPVPAIERSMSALIAWAEFLTDEKISIQASSFCHDKPSNTDQYVKTFGNHIEFGAIQNSLLLDKSTISLPVKTSNAYLENVMYERATKVLSELNSTCLSQHPQETTTSRVNKLLSTKLNVYHQTDQICCALHLSRATLYRKLKSENTSFRELLDQARMIKTKEELMKNTTVFELCEMLGFKEPSTFYKAQKRWRSS